MRELEHDLEFEYVGTCVENEFGADEVKCCRVVVSVCCNCNPVACEC